MTLDGIQPWRIYKHPPGEGKLGIPRIAGGIAESDASQKVNVVGKENTNECELTTKLNTATPYHVISH